MGVLFSPTPTSAVDVETLGLLGRIAVLNTTLLEPFRNQPNRTEVRSCLQKLFTVIADAQRLANREDTTIAENDLARLWILAPSASIALLKAFEAKLDLDNWMS
ncbi:hypothetical protein [Nostoc sp.]|uniref:hypothetical protein n=1 Tax=Nostoc sp. TaxID=1180 RepID=UPI002FFC0DF3